MRYTLSSMRHLIFAAALTTSILVGPACGIIPPGAQGAGGGGGASNSGCDDNADCDQCIECAGKDTCRDELATCQDNSFCLGLDQCIVLCEGMVQCEDDCFAGNSEGIDDYVALAECIYCDNCPSACAGRCK
jgi:hypothetical protein